MKHTPGPWKTEQYMADPSTHNCADFDFRCQSDAPDGLIECCYTGKGRLSIIGSNGAVVADMKSPDGHDARLIAAAPGLLDFAIQYLYSTTGEYDPDSRPAGALTEAQLCDMARIIIAKATGQGTSRGGRKMKPGDYIYQEHTSTYGQITEPLKNGSFRAVVYGWNKRAGVASISGWYPSPVVIPPEAVPDRARLAIERRKAQLA